MPRKKAHEEVDAPEPVTGEQILAAIEATTQDAPPAIREEPPVIAPPIAPKPRTLKAKGGVVLLRYSGESPIKAIKDVPSGAKYRINERGLIAVYPADAVVLLKNKDFSEA